MARRALLPVVAGLALLATACSGASTPAVVPSSASPSPSAPPSASAGAAAPAEIPLLVGGTTHAVRGSGLTVTLPKGWTALPLAPKDFARALRSFLADNAAAADYLKGQDLGQLAKTFSFFALKRSSGGTTNVDVVDLGDTRGISDLEATAQIRTTLSAAGARRLTVEKRSLAVGDVIVARYTLSVGGRTLSGEQYDVLGRERSLAITFSTDDLAADQKVFDAIAQGLRATR